MSILGRRVSAKALAGLAALMLFGALLPALSRTPDREVTLIAKGMAFYLEGDSSIANPTIDVRAGERLRIVLYNQDRGMTHDFAVPSVAAGMNAIDWNQSGEVVLDVPDSPGTYEYICRPHALMMRGTIRVH